MSTNWNNTTSETPPEGEWVLTISEKGQEAEMRREGNLYFFRNGMYAYYTPEKWRKL